MKEDAENERVLIGFRPALVNARKYTILNIVVEAVIATVDPEEVGETEENVVQPCLGPLRYICRRSERAKMGADPK